MELPHLLNQNARAGSEPGGCFFVIVESRRQEMERTVGIKGKEEFFGELEQDWLAIDKGGKPRSRSTGFTSNRQKCC